jgi:hypothetical protein
MGVSISLQEQPPRKENRASQETSASNKTLQDARTCEIDRFQERWCRVKEVQDMENVEVVESLGESISGEVRQQVASDQVLHPRLS